MTPLKSPHQSGIIYVCVYYHHHIVLDNHPLQEMAETRHFQLPIVAQEAKEENGNATNQVITELGSVKYKRWICILLCIIFLLCGQSVAALLGRLYFDEGGKSKWLSTLIQFAGFPILVPLYCISRPKMLTANHCSIGSNKQPSIMMLGLVYVTFGLMSAGIGFLYSVGMQYLPISTVTLIAASQLAFNAFFSYFLNSQRFTPFIINSLVLLTISSVLLVFNNNSSRLAGVSQVHCAAGFICTILGTAGSGLLVALQQFALRKLVVRQSFKVVLDLVMCQSLVASSAILVGFFASGDWKGFSGEMDEYGLGKFSYLMVLIWTAICWAVFYIGAVGLVLEVSALFCTAISALGLPIVPIIAVFVFNDKMDGIKVISMVLAIWGFISYVYQQYLDDYMPKTENTGEISEACSSSIGLSEHSALQGAAAYH
ncbi:hypothetical protein Gotur_015711 [Gossypium turneri]